MRAIGHSKQRSLAWVIAASFILHLIVGAALTLVPGPTRPKRAPEASIAVEIMTFRPPAPAVSGAPLPQDSASAPETTPNGMMRATHMLSEQSLADPRSQEARKMLPMLAADERMEQLCAIEAMAQIKAWKSTFQPDHVVAYAMAETKILGNALLADGAAFHSDRHWYNVKYKCELTADHDKVVAFEFIVGDVVPRHEWERHNLPVGDGSLD
jgi:hypothetical protein